MRRMLGGIVMSVLATAAAATTPPPSVQTLAERIDAHIGAPRFAAASWGIQVVSLDSGKTLYEHDAQRLLVPASTAKLYTGALALATFGPNHRIATSLMANARPLRDGTLRGDLILYGYGDPTLGTAAHPRWADELAEAARKAGIRRVEGDLVADATAFAAPAYGGGWEAADLQSWFAVPASALGVSENVVRAFVRPGEKADQPALIRFEPEVLGQAFEVINGLRTVAPPERSDISLIRRPGDHHLHAFGSVALRAKEAEFKLALPDPPLLAGHLLRRALGERGIEVVGKLRSVSWPSVDDARVGDKADKVWRIADTWSPPLSSLLERGFKVSQNLYLQNLLLLVGTREAERIREAAAKDPPNRPEPAFRTTEQLGLAAMRRYLGRLGIAPAEVSLDEGAGLSRRNLSTAAAFVKLLVAQADDPAARAFRNALPVAGVDGTLGNRLKGAKTRGHVFAKTGAMRNVVSLAGYATTATGERIAFAILLNGYIRTADSSRMSAELDAIAEMLVDAPAAAQSSQ